MNFATFELPVNSPQGPSQSRPDRKQLQLLRQPWYNCLISAISLIKQWFMVKLKAALDQCWLPVKLLHHLNLNWVFPRIVQWRFGRDLSWVAYSHLDIRLVTEVYTNRERYMQNTFFWHTCVFCFVFLPESLQLQYDHRVQLSPPANSTFHCNFVIFPPQYFPDPIFSLINTWHPPEYQLVLSIFLQLMSTCPRKRRPPAQSQSHQDHYQHTWGSIFCCSRWSGLKIYFR